MAAKRDKNPLAAKVTARMAIHGRCTKLVMSSQSAVPAESLKCDDILMNVAYATGRIAFWFGTKDGSVVLSFSGAGARSSSEPIR